MRPLRVLVIEDTPADIGDITKPSTLQGFRHVVRQLEDFWFCLVKLPVLSPFPR